MDLNYEVEIKNIVEHLNNKEEVKEMIENLVISHMKNKNKDKINISDLYVYTDGEKYSNYAYVKFGDKETVLREIFKNIIEKQDISEDKFEYNAVNGEFNTIKDGEFDCYTSVRFDGEMVTVSYKSDGIKDPYSEDNFYLIDNNSMEKCGKLISKYINLKEVKEKDD